MSRVVLSSLLGAMIGCSPSGGASAEPQPVARVAPTPKRAPNPKPRARPSTHDPDVIEVGGSTLRLVIDPRHALQREIRDWVRFSAQIVADYCDGFPVPSLKVEVPQRGGGGIGFGQHWDGVRVRVAAGRRTSYRSLAKDWVMVHELLHTAFPDLRREHRWMQEGLSTYLEPIVRARAGSISEARVWRGFMRSMQYGLPRSGDRGLDNTGSWGATYWGGTLFWFVADVEIRRRTDNRKSLRDVILGLLKAGGNGRADWTTAKVVAIGDRATGTTVLAELYAEMAEAPSAVNLPRLWHRLGLERSQRGDVVFDEDAELAHIRRAITRIEPGRTARAGRR